MTTSVQQSNARAKAAHCTDNELVVLLVDGRVLAVPLAWFPRLLNATAAERERLEFSGDGEGIHWPALDEDISVAGLLRGEPSVKVRSRRTA